MWKAALPTGRTALKWIGVWHLLGAGGKAKIGKVLVEVLIDRTGSLEGAGIEAPLLATKVRTPWSGHTGAEVKPAVGG